jgi:hypothetical protein
MMVRRLPRCSPRIGDKNDLIAIIDLRQKAYKAIVASEINMVVTKRITETVLGGFALSEIRFDDKIDAALGQRVTLGLAGRPRKHGSE